MPQAHIIQANCLEYLKGESLRQTLHLTFLDPPFNQGKEYNFHDDNLTDDEYWTFMREVCQSVAEHTADGGAIYFMQREKNTEGVLRCLRETGWTLQNLIIWKKKTSAVPVPNKYGKQYQVIAYASKGAKPRLFHRLRISPPLPPNYKYEREDGVFVTDVWDDIRELTSGYFAGDEALRTANGERVHKQQAPIALLLRIILSSSRAGDTVLDPFAGTGTTVVVANQLLRNSIGIEIDPQNVEAIKSRLQSVRKSDDVQKYYQDYEHTPELAHIWGNDQAESTKPQTQVAQTSLFG